MFAQCPRCGRILARVTALVHGEAIDEVRGVCRRHGTVQAEGEFWWEDFYGWTEMEMH